jgi:hypothetical protein
VVAELREQLAFTGLQPQRRGSGVELEMLGRLRGALHEGQAAARATREALEGLVPEVWVDEYLQERLLPLQGELRLLQRGVRRLDPSGYRAAVASTGQAEALRTCLF